MNATHIITISDPDTLARMTPEPRTVQVTEPRAFRVHWVTGDGRHQGCELRTARDPEELRANWIPGELALCIVRIEAVTPRP